MPAPRKYPQELRDRAQRLVAEAQEQDPELSLNAAVKRIGERVGVNPDTLRGWCKQAAIDRGERPGTTSSDAKRIKDLEHEVRELRRANEASGAQVCSAGDASCLMHIGGGLARAAAPARTVHLAEILASTA